MLNCPPANHLEDLLAETLADDARTDVLAHVEQCAACQETLRRLSEENPRFSPTQLMSAITQTSNPTRRDFAREADEFLGRLKGAVLGGSSGAVEPATRSDH